MLGEYRDSLFCTVWDSIQWVSPVGLNAMGLKFLHRVGRNSLKIFIGAPVNATHYFALCGNQCYGTQSKWTHCNIVSCSHSSPQSAPSAACLVVQRNVCTTGEADSDFVAGLYDHASSSDNVCADVVCQSLNPRTICLFDVVPTEPVSALFCRFRFRRLCACRCPSWSLGRLSIFSSSSRATV